ncbi:hypothetical protein [Flavihumibacter solisilvae]|uniref:Membrane or secreted protein n=1 Tax=Flavihumibacter solisilvae TaxID=1349421 RepID=A0A0C1LLV0_9BACT|nr:hypothetical protein [Flavihumibacter solisilvae]KIC96318.1 hypothetical protein OI18_00725 [Flavihumibacter solisilvae]
MKRLLYVFLSLLLTAFANIKSYSQQSQITGAWTMKAENLDHVLLFTNGHYSYSVYSVEDKKFHHTDGGIWRGDGNNRESGNLQLTTEFNTSEKSLVGKTFTCVYAIKEGRLETNITGKQLTFTRIDAGNGPLNATWRISAREQNGELYNIPPAARKTIKILTGTRFQWAAINTETGEFFGTGGGTYSFTDGRYTEKIEFFSRDGSRVGMQLSFEGSVKEDKWQHRGKSSKGDPIYEVWTKED